jgi:hypothetical protein
MLSPIVSEFLLFYNILNQDIGRRSSSGDVIDHGSSLFRGEETPINKERIEPINKGNRG